MYLLPKLKGKEIIMYLRKSRSDDPLASVDEVLMKHEQILDEWMTAAQSDAGPIPEGNRYREVESGETLESRPKMMELLRRIESSDIKAVLVKEPSRLSRGDLQDIGYLVKVLMYTGTLVFTTQGSYDMRDDRDREQFERELMRGNDYLQYQKKILKAGKLLAVKNGNYLGAFPPYGYRKVHYKVGRENCATLEPYPEEAEVVKRIFDMYVQGDGAIRICEALDAEHIKPPRGKKWSPSSVNTILKNVHYIGKVRWNYVQQGRKVENGEIMSFKFRAEDYLVFDGKHPAIIEQERWDAVQTLLGQIPKTKRGTKLKNPLAGLMYCSCGRMMQYKQIMRNRKTVALPRFMCGDPRCKESGSSMSTEVLAALSAELKKCVDEFQARIEQGVDNSAEIHRQTLARLEKKLEQLREMEVKQWDEKMRGGMPDHVFERLNAQTVAEIEDITQAICIAKDSTPVHVDLHEKIITFENAIALLDDPESPVELQNKILKLCVERIVYRRPKLTGYAGKRGNTEPFSLEFTLRV